MRWPSLGAALMVVVLVVALAACGGRPLRHTPVDEVRDGPGLLSGEDGEFVIYRSN